LEAEPVAVQQQNAPKAPSSRTRRTILGVGVVALGIGVTGCGPSLSVVTAPWSESQAIIQSSLFGEKNVTFDEPPVIEVDNGRIGTVTVKDNAGDRVGGTLVDGGAGWQLDTTDMDFGTKYTVSATAVDMRGNETSVSDDFKTFVPDKELTASTNLEAGTAYGVGMPVTMSFSQPVKNKKAIEQRLHVTTDTPEPIVGAWNWESDTLVTYRPKEFWPAHTDVELFADIKGVNAGDDTYATENKREKFKIGSSFIMEQNSATHEMKVKKDGKVIRTMPTSTGGPGHETRSGTKVIMSKEDHVVMDAATLGVSKDDPDYYRLDVYYAMRITWSGEYIHSAPWSTWAQGNSNVSHGCVNVAPDNAIWLFNTAKIGDPVIVKNTGVTQDLGNGWTMWEESWNEWKSGSALDATASDSTTDNSL
jgi:lipoprotein-anchoring transpeptidase ErfK/SrfK